MSIKKHKNGSAAIIAIIIAVVVIGGGVGAYFATDGFGTNKKDDTPVSQVNDAKEKTAKSSSSGDKQVPAGFPTDMPIYKPSVVLTSSDDNGYRLGLQAKEAKEAAVLSFYKTELAKAGWSIKPNAALSSMLGVSKGDWSGSITVHESTTTDIGTTISYILKKN